MSQNNKKNLEMLRDNLRDLNEIARVITQDIHNKNNILKNGFIDCVECKTLLDKTNNRK